MTEIHREAGSGLPGRRGLTVRGDGQRDRAHQSVEAVWLGRDEAPRGIVLTRVRARSVLIPQLAQVVTARCPPSLAGAAGET
jgi:hypothetical protein